ncbi:MAG: hypothetical protein EOP06_12605, partial [Proteobacteria bacterium]
MKLDANQKKWVLTTSLAAALSLNLVMSLSGNSAGSLSSASKGTAEEPMQHRVRSDRENAATREAIAEAKRARESEDFGDDDDKEEASTSRSASNDPIYADYDTADGVQKVKFEKNGSETRATIASGTCIDCGKKFNLPVLFSENVNDMKVALRRAQENKTEKNSNKKQVRGSKSGKGSDSEKDEAELTGKQLLANLTTECRAMKGQVNEADRVECFSTGLVEL